MSFCSLIKGITPKIRTLCVFVLILNLLCVLDLSDSERWSNPRGLGRSTDRRTLFYLLLVGSVSLTAWTHFERTETEMSPIDDCTA